MVVAAELSGDKVLCQEIIDKVDFHEANRVRFNLGEGKPGRLAAKVLKFRTIYGGSAYSFSKDTSMNHLSKSVKYWEDILEQYFEKYYGLKQWHNRQIEFAKQNGYLEIPSGARFPIVPDYTAYEPWPITVIKNYPVQGFGADLVMLARLEVRKRLREAGIPALLISTIHDSIVLECEEKYVEQVGRIVFDSIEYVPELCRQVFKYDFSLPLTSEVQYGKNKREMLDFKF